MEKNQQQCLQGQIFSNSFISELGKGVNSEASMSTGDTKLLQVIKCADEMGLQMNLAKLSKQEKR